uniref:polynucleotide adenylyltransferase n=1 Tax=Phallusia mammillata TaxID=59560 RepID=A0A6F9DD27_9ASCI|nr:protein FAM46C-like [Phallusia mammillata]
MAAAEGQDQPPVPTLPQKSTSGDSERPCREKMDYLRRFQLLGYREVTRLGEVMETVVPIHGTGNFPTLQICPSLFVELVRQRLVSIGVRVHNIRLNGSAATHVLSDDVEANYKDLDLIFTIDFPPSDCAISDAEEGRVSPTPRQQAALTPCSEDHSRKRKPRPTSLPTSPRQRNTQTPPTDDSSVVDDSGYTSSGSSVSSAPDSPTSASSFMQSIRERSLRPRTRSLESSTSSTSSRRSVIPLSRHHQHVLEQQYKDRCWQRIKDEVMDILLEFMPEGVSRTRMNSVVLSGAYVQKMVKVTNDSDRWSLISLNNNTGRNLELKFVQNMRRQFEFSVDSFQVVLDTYLAFRKAAQECGDSAGLEMSERFHATVIAESVYGNFSAAIRHLKHRRICTHKPEEIRGGGLLRYCNLRVRDYTPGDCDDQGNDVTREDDKSSSADPKDVERLEQHMCSRFFIDFSDIDCQQRKLISYLDSHFDGEPDLKLEYLVRLRDVVGSRTVCLMQHERALIYDLISVLMRQTMAQTVARMDASFQLPTLQEPCYHGNRQHHAQQPPQMQGYYYDRAPQFMTPVVYPGPPPLQHPVAMSDRSSPMSTYSSRAPSTHGDPCSPSPSPVPQSRPMTPNGANSNFRGQYLEPQPYGDQYQSGPMHPQYQPQYRRCYCCGCCCCCGGHVCEPPYQPQLYYPPTASSYDQQYAQNQTPTMPPIFYSPNTMTCFYQPAAYTNPQQA